MMGGLYALAIRLELLTPAGDLLTSESYNRTFTHAWRVDGILLLDSCHTRNFRKLSRAYYDRRKRFGISAD